MKRGDLELGLILACVSQSSASPCVATAQSITRAACIAAAMQRDARSTTSACGGARPGRRASAFLCITRLH